MLSVTICSTSTSDVPAGCWQACAYETMRASLQGEELHRQGEQLRRCSAGEQDLQGELVPLTIACDSPFENDMVNASLYNKQGLRAESAASPCCSP